MGLCWIDDDMGSMLEISNTVFCKLWSELDNLELDIKIFGDDYMKNPHAQEANVMDIKVFQNKIENKFRDLCYAIDREKWMKMGDTYKSKEPNMKLSCDIISCREDKVVELLVPWREVNALSTSGENLNFKAFAANDKACASLIEGFGIKTDDVVALDICLLHDDIERCKKSLPLLSMALYHQLNQEHHCYLYSKMSVTQGKKQKWKDVYRAIYDEEPPEIHSRFKLCEDNDSADYIVLKEYVKKARDSNVSE